MSLTVPKTMKALVLEEYGKPLQLKEVPIPKLKKNEVLIKIECSPLNPMDLSFIKGSYSSVKKLPATPGFEASGTVVASGGGLYGWYLVGKKVIVYCQRSSYGCYAEYAVTSAYQCAPMPDTVTFEQAATGIVNPLTVAMMHKKIQMKKGKAIISTPAASAVGRMLHRYLAMYGIKVINIVRRQEQYDLMKNEEKAEYVLISTSPTFKEDLKKLAYELDAHICFDAVGGPQAAVILNCMPDCSSLYVYGNLSLKNSEASQQDLIFKRKKIKGFWLVEWMKKLGIIEAFLLSKRLAKLYSNVLSTNFVKKYPLHQIDDAVRFYLKNMTDGKVLICPFAKDVVDIGSPQPSLAIKQDSQASKEAPHPKL